MHNPCSQPSGVSVSNLEECNGPRVREILSGAQEETVLSERPARDAYRKVSLLDGRYIAKRFYISGRISPFRRSWCREHRALEHLDDPRLPTSIGYVEDQADGRRVVTYVRDYVDATPAEPLEPEHMRETAALFAEFHRQRTVTDDALAQNFLRDPDGRLLFVDFGRSRQFRKGSPLFYLGVALEHTKFLRCALDWDRERWDLFRQAYFQVAPMGSAGKGLVRMCTVFNLWQRRLRKGK